MTTTTMTTTIVTTAWDRFSKHAAHLYISLPIRFILGAVFIYASVYKLILPRSFAISIAMYEMVPQSLVNLLAITLPAIELVVGVTLILGIWTRASSLLINGMLVVFIIAISYVVFFRGEAGFGCGCFSPAAEEAGNEMATDTLWRDVFYLLGGVYVMVFDDGALGVDGLLRRKRRKANGSNA